MPNGFRTMFPLAVALAVALAVGVSASPQLLAQVYRCESESGVTYSDMPCGESAEQIDVAGDVMDSRGLGGTIPAEDAGTAATGEGGGAATDQAAAGLSSAADGEPNLADFLAMLRSQRQQQMGQIDSQLMQLRQRAGSDEFTEMQVSEQDQLNSQIAQLESDRVSILSEYDALIAEAERRLD